MQIWKCYFYLPKTFITQLDFSRPFYPNYLLLPHLGWIQKFLDASPPGNIDFNFANNILVASRNSLNDRKIHLATIIVIEEVEHKEVDRQVLHCYSKHSDFTDPSTC